MAKRMKKSFHLQLSDEMILRRVALALQKENGELTFKVVLAKKQYKIVTNKLYFGDRKVFKDSENNEFCIFEIPFENKEQNETE